MHKVWIDFSSFSLEDHDYPSRTGSISSSTTVSPYSVLYIFTFKFLPVSTAQSVFSSQSSLNPALANPLFEIFMRIKHLTVCSQHMYCYEDKLNHSLSLSITLATSLSLQTSCELISYSFYIYFIPLSSLWCLAYIFDSFENIA